MKKLLQSFYAESKGWGAVGLFLGAILSFISIISKNPPKLAFSLADPYPFFLFACSGTCLAALGVFIKKVGSLDIKSYAIKALQAAFVTGTTFLGCMLMFLVFNFKFAYLMTIFIFSACLLTVFWIGYNAETQSWDKHKLDTQKKIWPIVIGVVSASMLLDIFSLPISAKSHVYPSNFSIESVSILITAFSTVILACITFWYARLNKLMLESQFKPCVVVYAEQRKDAPHVLQLIIRNVGNAPAFNVTFTADKPIPDDAWGISVDGAEDANQMTTGPLVTGIPFLAPGAFREQDWGQYGGLMKAIGIEGITIICCYERFDGKKEPPMPCVLTIKDFEGTAASTPTDARLAIALEKLEKHVGKISNDVSKLKVTRN